MSTLFTHNLLVAMYLYDILHYYMPEAILTLFATGSQLNVRLAAENTGSKNVEPRPNDKPQHTG